MLTEVCSAMADSKFTEPVNRGQMSQNRFPEWGDFSVPSGKFQEGSQGQQLEDLLRASVHNEVTNSQSKFCLKEIYSKLNFQEQRAMREKWFANDFGR